MKKVTIAVLAILSIFILASCDAITAPDFSIPSNSTAIDAQIIADDFSNTEAMNTHFGASEIDAEVLQYDLGLPSNIEIIHIMCDRTIYSNLRELEDQADIIVKAVVKENLGQEVSTYYDEAIRKYIPVAGYTKREIEVTQVYKGDVDVGDKLILHEGYFTWTYPDGYKQLVSSSLVKPMKKESEYLLFLCYNHDQGGYYRVGDYQGTYAIPTDQIKASVSTLEQWALEIYYDYETELLNNLHPIYKEVMNKYIIN